MTIAEARDILLDYVGVDDAAQADAAPLRAVRFGMEYAAEQVVYKGSKFNRDDAAYRLAAPTLIGPMDIAPGTTEITSVSPFTDADRWNIVRLDGDQYDNVVVDSTHVLYPTTGGSGSVSGLRFHNAVTLPATVSKVLRVEIPDLSPLLPLMDREAVNRHSRVYGWEEPETWHRWRQGYRSRFDTGQPKFWTLLERLSNLTPIANPHEKIVFIGPLPDREYTIHVEFEVAPQKFPDLAATTLVYVPRALDATVFIPIALKGMTMHPHWDGNVTRDMAELIREAERALNSGLDAQAEDRYEMSTPEGY